ncbi:MAG: DUF3592 domain-containing protein [Anaerolineaceae bacterium]|nr:MAG: DUF3592 domain-containing protein [Anaerolineaceae bacterium]
MSKLNKTLDTVEKGANRLKIGCMAVLINLFFMAFCLWGVYAGYISWKLQTSGEKTEGTVVRLNEQSDSEGGCCTYVPIVEFDAGGRAFSFEGGTASDPPAYRVGERMPVLYDPANPETAQIDKWSERWLFPILIIPAMLIAALVTTVVMFRAWQRGEDLED